MRSIKFLLLLFLCSCTGKQNPETKEWTAIYSIVHDSLITTDAKEFKQLSESTIQSSDSFLKIYQGNVFLSNQIIRKTIFAEILNKKGAVLNSINITTNYPAVQNELIRYNLYIVGDIKLYPFNDVNEFSNLQNKFVELSAMLVNDNNRK